ncbi:hypothetical protein BDN71DRAFT_1132317 [Pleurotus eryngii]|uniref:Late embryogenesis abundant protein LEA-2 subgroup domain-containing protein n=1 Tax=Pleurotus eryngii TaxID=5323 RepID=A0A9P6DBG8_PLEER|nr:hypothetical protein BDN71DRAFT_1132317 [Pleurotus eryngii]
MAYNDPYANQYSGGHQTNPHFGESQTDFNLYTNNARQDQFQAGPGAPSYANYGGYRDEPPDNTYGYNAAPRRNASQRTYTGETAQAMRKYRRDYQGNLITKGGRGRTCLRFFFCTLLIALFLFISIVLSLALWIRPPNLIMGDVAISNSSPFNLSNEGVTINLGVNLTVNNPNYFDVNLREVNADIFYPINNTLVGGGNQRDIVFKSHSEKNFTFPFDIEYKRATDPNNLILVDLASKCGQKEDIRVTYKIRVSVRILVITVSPTIENTFSIACPLDADAIKSLANGAGINLGDFGSALLKG